MYGTRLHEDLAMITWRHHMLPYHVISYHTICMPGDGDDGDASSGLWDEVRFESRRLTSSVCCFLVFVCLGDYMSLQKLVLAVGVLKEDGLCQLRSVHRVSCSLAVEGLWGLVYHVL